MFSGKAPLGQISGPLVLLFTARPAQVLTLVQRGAAATGDCVPRVDRRAVSWRGYSASGQEKRILPSRRPASTTSIPPDLIIHSRR